MEIFRELVAVAGACLLTFSYASLLGAQSPDPLNKPASTASTIASPAASPPSEPENDITKSGNGVETAVIHPFRSANVSSEVLGVIQEILFEEGDPVSEGDVVARLKTDRYATILKKVTEKQKGLGLSLALSEEELNLKEQVLSFDAASRQDVLRIRQEVEVKRQQVKEVTEELKLAGMDLDSCAIKSPFAGYIAVRYKQPFESVDRGEKLFAVVDTAKVYAVANVPEALLPVFRKGAEVEFTHASGKKYQGTVDRLGKLIDPKSRTTKVYVLIENPEGELEVGTTGSLKAVR
jgi:RND family efflux transporter MFP subunit